MTARRTAGAADQTSAPRAASEGRPPKGWPSPDEVHQVCRDPELLTLVAQPIIDMAGATVAGYELLSRFPHGRPDHWFAAATAYGMSVQLDAQVISRGLVRREHLPDNTFLTVNCEPQNLTHPLVEAALFGSGDLSRIALELTKHSQIDDYAALSDVLARVRDRGGLIAADDVGAGYPGLQMLLGNRPEIVKVDRSLVDHIDTQPAKQAIVRMLSQVAGEMDAWVLAEGIERVEELVYLMRLGVPLAQGYLLARPGPTLSTALPIEVVAQMRRQARMRDDASSVASLMSVVPQVPASTCPVDDESALCIEVDALGRPYALISGGRRLLDPLTIQLTEKCQDVARRMSACEGGLAHAVVVDPNGHARGVIDPRDVMAKLASVIAL